MKTLRLVVLSLACFPVLSPAWAAETVAVNTSCAPLTSTALENLPTGNYSSVDLWSIAVNPANAKQVFVGETNFSTNSNGQAQLFYTVGGAFFTLNVPLADDKGRTFTNSSNIQVWWNSTGAFYSEILSGPSQGFEVAFGGINTGGSLPTLQLPTPVTTSTTPITSLKSFFFKYDPGFYDIYLKKRRCRRAIFNGWW